MLLRMIWEEIKKKRTMPLIWVDSKKLVNKTIEEYGAFIEL